MTSVTITAYISGARNGTPWPVIGQATSLPDSEATQLVASGLATSP